ncbi:hypothetical protein [Undibacterium sp. Ji22W]|uniref:hypothetical protein n=1 Tax=Undibacterium sp. Ji22W TaxID=3413038 RepID=UPI003BF1F062
MEIIIIFGIAIIIFASISFLDHRRMRSIALNRKTSTICTYARSFDYRNVDTKIMREVYNHIQAWVGKYEGIGFPVEASDSFNETYKMDPDDLSDIYFEITGKLGICTDDPTSNPYWNQVTTVKNLVLFLNRQPKIKAT